MVGSTAMLISIILASFDAALLAAGVAFLLGWPILLSALVVLLAVNAVAIVVALIGYLFRRASENPVVTVEAIPSVVEVSRRE